MVEVKLNGNYFEFYTDGIMFYDFPKDRLIEFKNHLLQKKWFNNVLFNKCLHLINNK
jgi:hypothetical protein